MIKGENDKGRVVPLAAGVEEAEDLPYRIELSAAADRSAVERILARAYSAQLAQAIFTAALGEHPGRRIMLRRGDKVIADSDAPAARRG